MREVEVKIKISGLNEVLEKLKAQGCVFSDPVVQEDIVYIPEGQPTVPCPAGTNVLRIRKQGSRSIFTLKRSDAGNHLSKEELETDISDPEQLDKIIKLLGFKIIARTQKTRQKCRAGKFEICLDSVNELGDFLEIEEMTEADSRTAQKEMLEYLLGLGIDISKREEVGYDVLYVRKYGKK